MYAVSRGIFHGIPRESVGGQHDHCGARAVHDGKAGCITTTYTRFSCMIQQKITDAKR